MASLGRFTCKENFLSTKIEIDQKNLDGVISIYQFQVDCAPTSIRISESFIKRVISLAPNLIPTEGKIGKNSNISYLKKDYQKIVKGLFNGTIKQNIYIGYHSPENLELNNNENNNNNHDNHKNNSIDQSNLIIVSQLHKFKYSQPSSKHQNYIYKI